MVGARVPACPTTNHYSPIATERVNSVPSASVSLKSRDTLEKRGVYLYFIAQEKVDMSFSSIEQVF